MATETMQQIRERIRTEKYTFWYSQKHAEHYARMNETEHDEDEKIGVNFAAIDGKLIQYTCCTTKADAVEPYEGALKRWPDYRKVAEGTISNIRVQGYY